MDSLRGLSNSPPDCSPDFSTKQLCHRGNDHPTNGSQNLFRLGAPTNFDRSAVLIAPFICHWQRSQTNHFSSASATQKRLAKASSFARILNSRTVDSLLNYRTVPRTVLPISCGLRPAKSEFVSNPPEQIKIPSRQKPTRYFWWAEVDSNHRSR